MTDMVTIYMLYASSIAQVVLLGVASLYAFRIYRSVGSFASWTLVMSAFVIIAITNLLSFVSLVTLPSAQLDSLLASFSPATIWVPQIIRLGSSVALAAGVYSLSRIFKPRPKAPAHATPVALSR